MGACFSSRVKAESPLHTGDLRNASKDRNSVSRSGSKISSDSVPATPRSKISSPSIPATPRNEDDILQSSNLKSFSFNELKAATRNFRPDSVVGEGGFGTVFKGWIDERTLTPTKPGTGMVVAVKRLNQESVQGHKEWLAEINYLGQLHHPNLVRLIGYSLEDEHRLLVYEFMPRGSMENHLFRRGSHFQPLSWSRRMKIALDAAKGLAFLHSDEAKVIYRDFKTSNILLDLNYDAKLSDFGLARDGPSDDKSYVSTTIVGTQGYAAPEYVATGHLTPKSDVYSFGVVLLEMLSGRRAIDTNRPSGEQKLVEFAKPFLCSKRKIHRVMDTRLQGQYSLDQALRVSYIAARCLSTQPKLRPNMDEVVKELEKLQVQGTDHSTAHVGLANANPRMSTDDTSRRNDSHMRKVATPSLESQV